MILQPVKPHTWCILRNKKSTQALGYITYPNVENKTEYMYFPNVDVLQGLTALELQDLAIMVYECNTEQEIDSTPVVAPTPPPEPPSATPNMDKFTQP